MMKDINIENFRRKLLSEIEDKKSTDGQDQKSGKSASTPEIDTTSELKNQFLKIAREMTQYHNLDTKEVKLINDFIEMLLGAADRGSIAPQIKYVKDTFATRVK